MKKRAAVFRVMTWAAVALREMKAEKKIMTSKAHHSRQSIPVEGIPYLKKSIRPVLSKHACFTSCLNG